MSRWWCWSCNWSSDSVEPVAISVVVVVEIFGTEEFILFYFYFHAWPCSSRDFLFLWRSTTHRKHDGRRWISPEYQILWLDYRRSTVQCDKSSGLVLFQVLRVAVVHPYNWHETSSEFPQLSDPVVGNRMRTSCRIHRTLSKWSMLSSIRGTGLSWWTWSVQNSDVRMRCYSHVTLLLHSLQIVACVVLGVMADGHDYHSVIFGAGFGWTIFVGVTGFITSLTFLCMGLSSEVFFL